MAARTQRARGALAVGFGAGDDEAHDHFSLRKILFENRLPSPITVEDMLFGIKR